MRGGKSLLLLTVFVLLGRCQQKPNVSMLPSMKSIFIGDLLYLSCNNIVAGSGVKWYFNNSEKTLTNKIWKIAVVSSKHSGFYQCESDGQKSDSLSINVLEFLPSASLTIKTGHPVMLIGQSVILGLDHEDGLHGWNCWVYRGSEVSTKKIMFKLESNTSVHFQTKKLQVPETIFWCTDKLLEMRSNQIIVMTSAKDLSLEMYPFPAVVGERLILRCLVWGTDQISNSVLYSGTEILTHGLKYVIDPMTEVTNRRYGCNVTYTYNAYNSVSSYENASDIQELLVQDRPIRADLSANKDLTCSCAKCGSNTSYHFYNKIDAKQWKLVGSYSNSMTPQKSGIYACKAVWRNGRSLLSTSYSYQTNNLNVIVIVIVIIIVLLVILGIFYVVSKRKKSTTGQLYEEVQMGSKYTGDSNYDTLGAMGEEGGYEALRKKGMKGEVYYTLGAKEAEGGEGGYEALKKEGMKGEVYHTLGAKEAEGGEGGYEALKKEGMKGEVYHTLGAKGAEGGEGGYEALKKEGMKGEVYHTLGAKGAEGGEGGYEALKKEGMKGGVYHTLGGGQMEQ